MGTSTLIGRRANGRPIWLIQGGAEDPEQQPEQTPALPADDAAALRAELEQVRAENAAAKAEAEQAAERIRALMGGGDTTDQSPTASDDEDDEPKSTATTPAERAIEVELQKARRALSASNAENRRRRELGEKWEAETKAAKAALEAAAEDKRRQDAAIAAAEARFKPATVKAVAIPAFTAAGATAEEAVSLFKLLDMASLDVDADDNVNGLDEQIEKIKKQFPRLFAPIEPEKPRAPRLSGGDRPPVENTPTRSADRLAAQLGIGAA